MEDLLSVVQINKCSDVFVSKMLNDNADLFDMQHSMYKLFSEFVKKAKQNLLGDVQTIILGGGQSISGVLNTACWILQNDDMVKYSDLDINVTVNHGHSVCKIPGGIMLTGGRDSNLCVIFVFSMKMWVK